MVRNIKNINKTLLYFFILSLVVLSSILIFPSQSVEAEQASITITPKYREKGSVTMSYKEKKELKYFFYVTANVDLKQYTDTGTLSFEVYGPDNKETSLNIKNNEVIQTFSEKAVAFELTNKLTETGTYTIKMQAGENNVEATQTLVKLPFNTGSKGNFKVDGNPTTYYGLGESGYYTAYFDIPAIESENHPFTGYWATTEGVSEKTDSRVINAVTESGVYAVFGEIKERKLEIKDKDVTGNHFSDTITYGEDSYSKEITLTNTGTIAFESLVLPNSTSQFNISAKKINQDSIEPGSKIKLESKESVTLTLTAKENILKSAGTYSEYFTIHHDERFDIFSFTLNVQKEKVDVKIIKPLSKTYGDTFLVEDSDYECSINKSPDLSEPINKSILGLTFQCDGFSSDAQAKDEFYPITAQSQNENYEINLNENSKQFKVERVTPVVTANCTSITEGKPVSASILSCTATNPNNHEKVVGSIDWNTDIKNETVNQEIKYGWTFTPTDSTNYTNQTGSLNIITTKKIPTKISHDSCSTVVEYDGNPHPMIYECDRPDDQKTEIKVLYKSRKEGSSFTSEVPIDAGTYDVKATIEANADYEGDVHTDELIIKPHTLQFSADIEGVKTYDGTTSIGDAQVNIKFNKVRDTDDVSIENDDYTAHLEKKDAGDNQNVVIEINNLSGAKASNYQISQTSNSTQIYATMKVERYILTDKNLNLNTVIEREYGDTELLGPEDFNISDLPGIDTINDLNITFSSEGQPDDKDVGVYDINANLQPGGNYCFNDKEKEVFSTKIGDFKRIPTTPILDIVSAGLGYNSEPLKDVPLTVTFKNPHNNLLKVEGDYEWTNKEQLLTETKAYTWTFKLKDKSANNYHFIDKSNPVPVTYTDTYTGSTTVTVLDKKPISLKNIDAQILEYNEEKQEYPFNSEMIVEDSDNLEQNPVSRDNIVVSIQYRAKGSIDYVDDKPINVGEYDVQIIADAGIYESTRSDGIYYTSLTITKAKPKKDSVTVIDPENEVTNGILSKTKLSNVKLKEPIGVKDKPLKGSFRWEDDGLIIEKSGSYKYVFTPEDSNYEILTDSLDLVVVEDKRELKPFIEVFNLPGNEGDYARIKINAQNFREGDEIQFFKDANANTQVSQVCTIEDPNIVNSQIISLNSDALTDKLYVKNISTNQNSVELTYDKEPDVIITGPTEDWFKEGDNYKLNLFINQSTTLVMQRNVEKYTISSVNIAPNEADLFNIEGSPSLNENNDLTVILKGIKAGSSAGTCDIIFDHPDELSQNKTIKIQKNFTVTTKDIEVKTDNNTNLGFSIDIDELARDLKDGSYDNVLNNNDLNNSNKETNVTINIIIDNNVNEPDKIQLNNYSAHKLHPDYFEIEIKKIVTTNGKEIIEDVPNTTKELTFSIIIPSNIQNSNYKYNILTIHNNEKPRLLLNQFVKPIDYKLEFKCSQFSSFAIVYEETNQNEGGGNQGGTGSGNNPGGSSGNGSGNNNNGGGTGSGGIPGVNPGSGTSTNVTGVKISGDKNITLNTGSSKKLTVTLEPSGAQGTVKWSSSNSTVVKVDQNGNLTAVAPGTAVITAECNGQKATVTVKVSAATKPSQPQPSPQPQPQPSPQPSPSPEPTPSQTMEVYRLYLPTNNEHLYTTDAYEAQVLTAAGWTNEGVGWTSPTSGEGVYRLYSPVTNEHHYTSDVNEVNTLKNNGAWTVDNNEKPLFYSGGSQPIYRLYHEGTRRHHLTKDQHEYDVLRTTGWNDEGIALHSIS